MQTLSLISRFSREYKRKLIRKLKLKLKHEYTHRNRNTNRNRNKKNVILSVSWSLTVLVLILSRVIKLAGQQRAREMRFVPRMNPCEPDTNAIAIAIAAAERSDIRFCGSPMLIFDGLACFSLSLKLIH